ncbi:MAG: FlgD immunoglobulin-like domain containing protein [bacterium]
MNSHLRNGSSRATGQWIRCLLILSLCCLSGIVLADSGVHTTYLWHMHQPIYWPDASSWSPGRYETAYETITLGHSQNDVFDIFNKDDRVGDYQWYPRDAVSSIADLPQAGTQVSFAGSLLENLFSLGDNGWNGGRYAPNWYAPYREARGWTNSVGQPRLEPLLVGFHHAIGPLLDDNAFRMELACAQAIYDDAWGDSDFSAGFFPAETCFSERLIPALVDAGVEWVVVPDLHLARACADYPYDANQDNCDPPNPADQLNPAQGSYTSHFISRGVTLKVPYPFGFTPHRAQYVDPTTGVISQMVVVPAANAMSWEEGYSLFGTGGIDAIAGANNPSRPMLVLLAHDGDNAWSGGHSYYYENVTQFCHSAASSGYTPTTVASYLAQHPVPPEDVVHVEDGGWVNADGDFGSPQFINWNWPLVNTSGNFDIPGGWAEDQRNWSILTATQNRVETAAQIVGAVNPEKVVNPLGGANAAETAWHFLLAGYESGYMYYGSSLDMEIKATLACNRAVASADPVIAGGSDLTAPTIWLPQRLPWNPGGFGGGSLWGYPGGDGEPMSGDFHVWTFVYDVSELTRVELKIREDDDGWNDPATTVNETYAGGTGVSAWTSLPMNHRAFPLDEPWDIPGIDLTVLPSYTADEYWLYLTGYNDQLLDYFVEAEDSHGNVKRSPVQHVFVGAGGSSSGFVMDGSLDDGVPELAAGNGLSLWGRREGDLLYLATQGVGSTTGSDHFLLVQSDSSGSRSTVWAKSGSALPWDFFLGAEESNGWCGWFDAAEAVQSGSAFAKAQGTVLEGTLDLTALYGGEPPATLWIAAAGYATADGGLLTAQAPGGNGDGDLTSTEYYRLGNDLSATGDSPLAGTAWGLSLHPNPFNPAVTVSLDLPTQANLRLEVFDLTGRKVATLHDGPLDHGIRSFSWRGRQDSGRPCASGVYLFRASGPTRSVLARGVLVR